MSEKESKSSKWKSCKSRRETAVQGTNDSSIVSKCSMANVGYFDDPYLQKFVSKTARRAPLINRGYYIRAKTIDHILRAFLKENTKTKQILSLGAGFDSAYFRLKSVGLLEDTVFYEVDYPEVVKRKCDVIKSKEDLQTLIPGIQNQAEKKNPLIEINTDGYKLLGSDLSQLNTLEALLNLCGVDFEVPTLLLSECVLTYMTRRCSTAVVKWASETFPNSVFVLYEQINPSDAFGLFMQNHFQVIGSPLKCINAFPSIMSQKDRFTNAGWQRCEALDMNQFYHYLVPHDERKFVDTIEPFDEFEEWQLKCAHYMVICGYNGSCGNLIQDSNCELTTKNSHPSLIVEEIDIKSQVQRFGHSSTFICDNKFVATFGGFGESNGKHKRMTEISVTNTETFETYSVSVHNVDATQLEVSRMHNQVCTLSDGSVYMTGGRTSPISLCTQLLKVHIILTKTQGQSKIDQGSVNKVCAVRAKDQLSGKDVGPTYSVKNESSTNCPGCDGNRTRSSNEQLQVLKLTKTNNTEEPSLEENSNISTDNCQNCDDSNPEKSGNSEIKSLCKTEVDSNCQLDSRKVEQDVCNKENVTECLSESNLTNSNELLTNSSVTELDEGVYMDVKYSVIKQNGDVPCPRWRHTATVIQKQDKEMICMYGGRTDKCLALDDCYILSTDSYKWKMVPGGSVNPGKRHSHTMSFWNDGVYVTGGLDDDLRPLNTIYRLCTHTEEWTLCNIRGKLLPRYAHTAHIIDEFLVLIGGVNTTGSPPGVAVIDLLSHKAMEFPLPTADKKKLLMLHRHTSHYLGNDRILIIGGGGNCFSFGTHLNVTPVVISIKECLSAMKLDRTTEK